MVWGMASQRAHLMHTNLVMADRHMSETAVTSTKLWRMYCLNSLI